MHERSLMARGAGAQESAQAARASALRPEAPMGTDSIYVDFADLGFDEAACATTGSDMAAAASAAGAAEGVAG
eukprot:11967720-Alexandrium_andersonii.AAC.1